MTKLKCWEYTNCGREKGGKNENSLGQCPAYPDYGQECWTVSGTLCDGKLQGRYAEKIAMCKRCHFFRAVMDEEE